MKNICYTWNNILTIISIVNIIILIYFYVRKKQNEIQKTMYYLSLIYTIVCAIRAIYPRCDSTSICLKDNFISTPFVGRSLATVAEISFGFLIVKIVDIILNDSIIFSSSTNIENIISFNAITVSLTIISQVFCWIGITTKNPLYNAIEETLWTIFGLSKFLTFIFMNSTLKESDDPKLIKIKNFYKFGSIFSILYVLFMIIVDVPMYYKRYINGNSNDYMTFSDGIKTLLKCKKSDSYNDWKDEFLWLSLYFSFGVWSTIFILFWYDNYIK